jgi:hypothetical protein
MPVRVMTMMRREIAALHGVWKRHTLRQLIKAEKQFKFVSILNPKEYCSDLVSA